MTEIESAREYIEDVFADIRQARETYPFIEATLLPTVNPEPIQLKVAAVNKLKLPTWEMSVNLANSIV